MSRLTTAPSLAAAAVLLTALLAGCSADSDDTSSTDAGTPSETSSTDAGSTGSDSPEADGTEAAATLDLTYDAAPAGRCMMPNVDNLKAQDTAFEGVVSAIDGDTVTLDVTEAFKGDDVDTATITAPAQSTLQDVLVQVDFQQGQTYLVSSLDGKLSLCGLSGPKDETLSGLYDQAYAG